MDRVTPCSAAEAKVSADYVLYWMTSFRRRRFNFALERAVFWAAELRKPLLIVEPLACRYGWASARFHSFIIDGMRDNLAEFRKSAATYFPFVERTAGECQRVFSVLATRACVIVTDDFPAFEVPRWIEVLAAAAPVLMEKIDSNGLLPMRHSGRLFLTASSFRSYRLKMPEPAFPLADPLQGAELPSLKKTPAVLAASELAIPACVSAEVGPVANLKGGPAEARRRLGEFIESDRQSSGMSPYLHFGHISAHEIVHAVRERKRPESDRFLDQLLTWRELGFNRCALASDYDKYDSLPAWARNTLHKHAGDPRANLYSMEQLEEAATHDAVWNAAQRELVGEGRIHNYLRMLWGKKILEWSPSPEEALSRMIQLNNKYALDGRDPNSYSGIFWTLGRYDRPWGPERPIFGLIRYMSSANTARKLKKMKD